MSKAAISPICFIVLLATASLLMAQSNPSTDTAVNEAVRRQANRVALRQKLEEARGAQSRHDLVNAAKYYDEAWVLVEDIGSGIEPERQQTVSGLTEVRMQLARSAQARGDLLDADKQVIDVLRVNRLDAEALAFASANKKALEEQRGRIPSTVVQDQVPAIKNEKIEANTLVQDGRLLLQMGKLDEASAKLKQALKIDPGNGNAIYYSSLVEQARSKQAVSNRSVTSQKKLVEVQRAWEDPPNRELLPVPNPAARTNLVYTSRGRQAIMAKLDRIHLDTVFYDGLPLSEVVRNLSEEVKKRDPEKKGINILINPNVESVSPPPTGIGAGGREGFVNAPVAQPAIDPATGLPVPAAAPSTEPPVDLNGVTIRINPALSDVRLADVLEAIVTVASTPIKYSLQDYAVVFQLKGPETPQLYIRKFHVDPNTFYQGLENVGSLDFSTVVPNSGGGSGSGQGGQTGGQSGGQNGGQNGGQGGGTMAIPRVFASGNSGQGGQGGGGGGARAGGGGNINGGGGGTGANGGLGGGGNGGLAFITSQSTMDLVQTTVINFFLAVGVDLRPQTGKNVFFNDREGTLMVRATSQDLDIIEAAVESLNVAPPQVTVKSKFVEVTQNDTKALGFEWYLGNFLMGGKSVGAQGGTAPSFNDGNGGVFPGVLGTPTTTGTGTGTGGGNTTTTTGTAIQPSTTDQLVTSGLRNSLNAPALATVTGILTDPQFRVVIHALEQRDGADTLSEGQVTTLSGRQAQIQVVDLKYIVTGSGVQNGQGGSQVAGGTGSTIQQQGQQAIIPTTTLVPLGPTLDVVPYVCADGYTIQMTIIPTITEFLGYDDPGQFLIQAQLGAGVPITSTLPLPHFRVRQVTTSAIVWDSQTIVLGGLVSENVSRFKDKVPVLGDLPLLGRFFRNEANQSQKKNLLIFVTPTIIDPAGNRVNSDEELPFIRTSIPAQKTVSSNP